MARRRFQFRLRTLFVVVTVMAVACWYIAGQWRIVCARKDWLKAHPGYCTASLMGRDPRPEDPSFLRVWLGDEAIAYIEIEDKYRSEARSLFPEVAIPPN
jgi:hypothetical protein